VGHFVQEDHELVATESRRGIAGTQRLFQPLRHLHQQAITDIVSEGIVDHFETVEVQKQNRDHALAPAQFDQGTRESIHKE